ncbi:MAG: hypothetical protein CMC74_06850 [Flavobacteriaceae bacterium]|nr:hypothetical protein [Flavobacteriaceae bacterium]|tara:strand:+ start:345 stop:1061 length:717 start_codon:yes stop_codon:yes gene_type:complete
MKRLLLAFLFILYLSPKAQAQNDGLIGAVAGIAAIGGAIVAIENMKEQAELKATEYVLNAYPEMASFSLKTLDFDGKKGKDMASASLITYKIQEFSLAEKPELDGKKFVLFGFTSYGWVNEYGVDFSKVQWIMIDAQEWLNMMVAYVKTASSETNDGNIREILKEGKIVNRGVKDGLKTVIPFYKMNGDMYTVRDYNDTMKFVYNERSLGIYLKETQNLIQIGRDDIIEIHDFFFGTN